MMMTSTNVALSDEVFKSRDLTIYGYNRAGPFFRGFSLLGNQPLSCVVINRNCCFPSVHSTRGYTIR